MIGVNALAEGDEWAVFPAGDVAVESVDMPVDEVESALDAGDEIDWTSFGAEPGALPLTEENWDTTAGEGYAEGSAYGAGFAAEAKAKKAKKIPVLGYHKVVSDEDKNSPALIDDRYSISLSKFTEQMEYLSQKQYTAITCKQLYQWHQKKRELPERSVLITFDDGYSVTLDNAVPVLERFGLRGTVFVIGKKTYESDGTTYITMDRIQEVKKNHKCIEFQSHTWDLHNAERYSTSAKTFKKDAKKQIKVYGFYYVAYPHGYGSKVMVKAYRECGIKLGFTFGEGINGYATRKQNRLKLRRIGVTGFMEMDEFMKWCP